MGISPNQVLFLVLLIAFIAVIGLVLIAVVDKYRNRLPHWTLVQFKTSSARSQCSGNHFPGTRILRSEELVAASKRSSGSHEHEGALPDKGRGISGSGSD